MTPTAIRIDPRLLQLASPALPVGAFSYSQGLESAVEEGIVADAGSAARWIEDMLEHSVSRLEAPLLLRSIACWREGDGQEARRLNDLFLCTRETAELRAETVQMGYSLKALLASLGAGEVPLEESSYPAAYAYAAAAWEIELQDALVAYLWSWAENQAMAALKAVPLGQTEVQRLLLALGSRLPALVARAARLPEDEWTNFTPGLARLSSRHETQYSRLFRS